MEKEKLQKLLQRAKRDFEEKYHDDDHKRLMRTRMALEAMFELVENIINIL